MRLLTILLLVVLISSCEKEVELDIPRSPQQLVVNAILMPAQEIEVNVSLSQYVMDTSATVVLDAVVNLYCEDDFVAQLTHSKDGKYSKLDLKPQEGKTYSIAVSVEGFATATAQTTVPDLIELDSLIITQGVGLNENGDKASTFDLYFNKNDKGENYYNYACAGSTDTFISYYTHYETGDTLDIYYNRGHLSNSSCYHPAILKDGDEQSHFFSDKEIETELINLKLFTSFSVWNLPIGTCNFEIEAQVTALSKEQYLFQKSLANYLTQQGQILGDNNLPRLYSNVNNALGCFSAIAPGNIIIENEEVECKGWE